MNPWLVIVSSSVVAALVGGVTSYVSQRSLVGRQARVSYEYQARQRLYAAIGPLRFQLLMACRDVERRITGHVIATGWNLRVTEYYGKSTLFRLLRPLAICILIQRQMNDADFSVDTQGRQLLQFEISAYRMLTGSDPLPGYAGFDWSTETQHVFRDNLRRAAIFLIDEDHDHRPYVIDFAEFDARANDPVNERAIAPLARIINACGSSLTFNSVFWVRLLGYAYVCNLLVNTRGVDVGFQQRRFQVAKLMLACTDPEITARAAKQEEVFATIAMEPL